MMARFSRLPAVALAGLGTGALALADGGYFPTSWGWAALGFAWVSALALLFGVGERPAKLELAFLGGLASFAGWTWLSAAWSLDPTQTVLEGERSLVVILGIGAAVVLGGRRRVAHLLGGLTVAIAFVCAYALLTRLLPEHFGRFDPIATYRLAEPIGYWNGLGLFAAIGVVLAIGFSARGSLGARAAAAAAVVILATTLYFTFSRGASMALGLGLLAMLALDSRRLQLVAAASAGVVPGAIATLMASRSEALTRQRSTLTDAAEDGRRLLVAVLVLGCAAAVAAFGCALAERRVTVPRNVRAAFAASVLVAAVVALGAVFVRFGGPVTLGHKAYRSFTAPPIATQGNLNRRLLSLSSNGRTAEWRVAWDEFRRHELAGTGAGTYEVAWLRERATTLKVRDAHSLYIEALAEVGVVGFALLCLALAIPLAGLVRERRHPLVAAAAGGYVTYLLVTGVDWDWELPAVTLAGLLCGVAILAAGRENEAPPLAARARGAALGATVILATVAFVGLAGNLALSRSADAADADDYARSASHAKTAGRWAPWSSEPWRLLGEAQTALDQGSAARVSVRRAIAKDPHDWLLWYDLAGASDGAAQRRALARAKELNPRSPEIAEFERDFGVKLR